MLPRELGRQLGTGTGHGDEGAAGSVAQGARDPLGRDVPASDEPPPEGPVAAHGPSLYPGAATDVIIPPSRRHQGAGMTKEARCRVRR